MDVTQMKSLISTLLAIESHFRTVIEENKYAGWGDSINDPYREYIEALVKVMSILQAIDKVLTK
jgi:hypothetical protein